MTLNREVAERLYIRGNGIKQVNNKKQLTSDTFCAFGVEKRCFRSNRARTNHRADWQPWKGLTPSCSLPTCSPLLPQLPLRRQHLSQPATASRWHVLLLASNRSSIIQRHCSWPKASGHGEASQLEQAGLLLAPSSCRGWSSWPCLAFKVGVTKTFFFLSKIR
jgi:hypothetical protein